MYLFVYPIILAYTKIKLRNVVSFCTQPPPILGSENRTPNRRSARGSYGWAKTSCQIDGSALSLLYQVVRCA